MDENEQECLKSLDQPPSQNLQGCFTLSTKIPKIIDCFKYPNDNCDSLKFGDIYHDRNQTEIGPGLCAVQCANYNFTFAGISGRECLCSNDILFYKPASITDCNNTCSGKGETYQCGGGVGTYSVYSTEKTLFQFKWPKITAYEKINIIRNLRNNSQYVFVGCIKDYCEERTFKNYTEHNGMTIDMCIDLCRKNGFNQAGIEIGNQCSCNNASSYDNKQHTDDFECSSSCTGKDSSLSICGGKRI
jgi:hypothetical protein